MTARALAAAALGYLIGWGTAWAIANVRCGGDGCCGPDYRVSDTSAVR